MLRYTTDRARPGLVALYDIRPGNGAGQFLQPRSPHGAFCDSVNNNILQPTGATLIQPQHCKAVSLEYHLRSLNTKCCIQNTTYGLHGT